MARTMEMDRNSEPGAIVAGTEPLSGLAPVTALRGPCAAARSLPCTVGLTAHGAGGPSAGLTATIESREPGAESRGVPAVFHGGRMGRGATSMRAASESSRPIQRRSCADNTSATIRRPVVHFLLHVAARVRGARHPGARPVAPAPSAPDASSRPWRRLRTALLALLALAAWAAPPLVPEAEAQTTTEVWSTTMTVGNLGGGSVEGYIHSSDTSHVVSLSNLDGSLADDDFDIGGTTYSVWQLFNATGTGRLYFRTVTGSPAEGTELPDDDELTLQLQSSTNAADFSTYSYRLQSASWDATYKRYHWSTSVTSDVLPSGQQAPDTLTVKLIRTTTSGLDTTAPRVTSIVRNDPTTSPTNYDSLIWRVTFSENVQNVDDADFRVSGTTATPTVTEVTASSVYDVTVSGGDLASLDGTVTLSLASGQNIADTSDNDLSDTAPTGTNANTYVLDNTAPTVTSIVRQTPSSSPTNADSLTWRFTFSEGLVNAGELSHNYDVSGTTATLAITYVTASVHDVTASGGGLAGLNATVSLVLDADRFSNDLASRLRDDAGNLMTNATPTGTNDNTWVVDNTAPTVAITGVLAASSAAFTATFTFSEDVTGFTVDDIDVGNGAASAFTETTAGRVFTALITPAASGTVTVDVAADAATDEAGNDSTAAAQVSSIYTTPLVDTTAPRVASIVRQTPTSSPTNADSLTWRVTFSEDVKNVDAADFAIAGTTATLTVTVATASTEYDVTASGGNLAGLDATVTLSIASGQNIADTADNNLSNTAPTGTNDNTWVVDNTAPTVTITGVPDTSSAAFTATFTFTEAVTGFVAGDITLGNATASTFTVTSTTVYTALITPTANGAVTVDVAAAVALDATGNGNTAATRASSTYTMPVPTITIAAGTTPVTEGASAAFTLTRSGGPPGNPELTVNVSVTETEGMVAAADKGAKTVTFQANSATAMLGVATVADSVDETDSVVTATVTANPATYTVGTSSSATVTVTDDDTRGVTVSAPMLDVNEGSSGTYTVVLDSEPTASVTVTPSSGNSDVTVSSALTFTTMNWSTAQMVTVTAAHDSDAVDDSATISHAVAGGDYGAVTAASVTVTVDDDETADTTAPRVASIVRGTPSSSPTNADSLTWRVTFSEAVSNVDTADFAVNGTTATLSVSAVSGVTGAYDVTASGGNLAGVTATGSPCPLPRATTFRTRRAMR